MKNDFRLDGKVALISGSARGLGAAMAETFVAAGAKVVIADLLMDEGKATANNLGANAAFITLDVTREESWHDAMLSVLKSFGSLDIVINNAAIETMALFSDCTLDEFRRTMEVNVTGAFLGIKYAIRAMRPGGLCGRGGSIVNLSSGAGIKGVVGMGAYCTSKGAVRQMTKAAAVECARLGYGIRVNSIHPGLIRTEMGTKTLKDHVRLGLLPDEAAAESAFAEKHLLGLGQPRDIANGVCYLASDAARWVTGTELLVDGGYVAA